MKNRNALHLLCLSGLFMIVLVSCQDSALTTSELEPEMENKADGYDHAVEVAFPDVKGELVELGEGDYTVVAERKVVEGEILYIFQGDIVLNEEQVEFLKNRGSEKSQKKGAEVFPDPEISSTFIAELNRLWPNGTIYYTLNNPPHPQRVYSAISHWENNTNLTFVPRTSQSNYVEFTSGSGCSAQLGMAGGKQRIWLHSDCSTGTIIHEIGHAVGLFHEHQRSDRNNFITVHSNNIQSGKQHNFIIYHDGGSVRDGFEIGQLDFGSIMMYGPCAFSVNSPCNTNNATITRTNGSLYSIQRNALSSGDLDGVKYLYYPGVYTKVVRTFDSSASYDNRDSMGHGDYHLVYNVSVYFYSNSGLTQPLTLQHPIEFRYRRYLQTQNPGIGQQNLKVLIGSGVSSKLFATDIEEGYDEFGEPVWLNKTWHEKRQGIGYN